MIEIKQMVEENISSKSRKHMAKAIHQSLHRNEKLRSLKVIKKYKAEILESAIKWQQSVSRRLAGWLASKRVQLKKSAAAGV